MIPVTANRVGSHHPRNDLDHDTYVMAHGQANAEIQSDGEPSLSRNHEAPILFSCKDSGHDAGEISPTLRSMGQKDSHTNGIGIGESGDEMFTLTKRDQHAIAFTERSRKDGRNFESQEEIAYALTNPGSGGRTHSRSIAVAMSVRRLVPAECEKLQGFPPGWTEGFSDSTRYRMLGNAVAVPCAQWIARRIKIPIRVIRPQNTF